MRSALSLAVWALVWELVGRAQLSGIVPPLSGVVEAAFTVVPTEKFRTAALISLRSYGLGMALAVAVGIPLGLWIYESIFRAIAEGEGADPTLYTPPEWWALALLVPGAVALAALASALPARRAANVHVAEVLRYE